MGGSGFSTGVSTAPLSVVGSAHHAPCSPDTSSVAGLEARGPRGQVCNRFVTSLLPALRLKLIEIAKTDPAFLCPWVASRCLLAASCRFLLVWRSLWSKGRPSGVSSAGWISGVWGHRGVLALPVAAECSLLRPHAPCGLWVPFSVLNCFPQGLNQVSLQQVAPGECLAATASLFPTSPCQFRQFLGMVVVFEL